MGSFDTSKLCLHHHSDCLTSHSSLWSTSCVNLDDSIPRASFCSHENS
jgi:hypothetical protein